MGACVTSRPGAGFRGQKKEKGKGLGGRGDGWMVGCLPVLQPQRSGRGGGTWFLHSEPDN